MIDFITEGVEFEKAYGVNGIGSGRMPRLRRPGSRASTTSTVS